eukprot:CAMPEP_0197052150 /NCGR_PEP_ID=MMETSP1384-20130603/26676_1 /TAXON_ID=29189 /ORGANISM="Ammonia sp." /LENGTH=53 /DNA_ID=CAMNT_0042484811 /DNA_START=514 /DNA_END=675 /DNA_ORIENTATION=-
MTEPITAAMFALVQDNQEIVEWLEEQGATQHKAEIVSLEGIKERIEKGQKQRV